LPEEGGWQDSEAAFSRCAALNDAKAALKNGKAAGM
jgi:hypothetical protein